MTTAAPRIFMIPNHLLPAASAPTVNQLNAAIAHPDTIEITGTTPALAPVEPGDHDTFSHYATKDQLLESAVNGTPVVALCGKVWVPTKNPENYPTCPECKDIYDNVVGTGDTSGPDHSGGDR